MLQNGGAITGPPKFRKISIDMVWNLSSLTELMVAWALCGQRQRVAACTLTHTSIIASTSPTVATMTVMCVSWKLIGVTSRTITRDCSFVTEYSVCECLSTGREWICLCQWCTWFSLRLCGVWVMFVYLYMYVCVCVCVLWVFVWVGLFLCVCAFDFVSVSVCEPPVSVTWWKIKTNGDSESISAGRGEQFLPSGNERGAVFSQRGWARSFF